MIKESKINRRLRKLEKHLKQENPMLADVVQSFRDLDRISRRLGYFHKEESHAVRTPWWPLISILGIYSSGKSTFINHFLHYNLQPVGIQAVDDKFTVICFTRDNKERVLPGVALDADPRFPLYKISQAIDAVAEGSGEHIDAYLQLKTCPSEILRGKILIDSPGFDADAQRTSTLRITDHIIDLSDLVLVFFDARHPETGSMRDTLEHLVKSSVNRRDSNKFLYILNQIDVAANEDSLEEVFAAWQRALAQYGLTAGCSYAIYNADAAIPFENEDVRHRFENKRKADTDAIYNRIEQVGVERAYRIVGMLEQTAQMLKQEVIPLIQRFIENWRHKILWLEGIVLLVLLAVFLAVTVWGGYWEGLSLKLPFWDLLMRNNYIKFGALAVLIAIAVYTHLSIRQWAARKVIRKLLAQVKNHDLHTNYTQAFRKNSKWWRSVIFPKPAGWGRRNSARLEKVLEDSNTYIQKLNDEYTNPSGAGLCAKTIEGPSLEGSQCMEASEGKSADPFQDGTGSVTSDS
jgi:hypothetical protein